MSETIKVRVPKALADDIDAVRGDVPRERWVVRALIEALGGHPQSPVAQLAEQRPVTAPVAGSTPARGASSAVAKARAKPIPKGAK